MGKRPKMETTDWLNAISLVAIGVFLGLALDFLLQFDGAPFWIVAISMPIVLFGCVAIYILFERLNNRIFESGTKPARVSRKEKRKPVGVLLAMPAGIVIGLIGGQFGLGHLLL